MNLTTDRNPDQQWWLAPTKLFDGRNFQTNLAIGIKAGKITKLAALTDIPQGEAIIHSDHQAIPGFFDIQINGGGNAMFNNEPSVETLETIYQAHLQFGTTSWLPTFITDTDENMQKAVDAVIAAKGKYGIAGIHLEGPYLNLLRKGTHKPDYIRSFEPIIFELAAQLKAADIPLLITLAPECAPQGAVQKLIALGAIISAGHSNATAAEAQAGLAAGISCFTHLYNAMPPMTSRAPGIVAEALDSQAYCGIIADGFHVSYQMLALAIRARKLDHHMIVVTDAMATVGGADHFSLYGEKISVSDGKLINQNGDLAGAHIDMIASVINLISHVGLTPESAFSMATQNPATLMSVQNNIGIIAQGANADILLLDDEFGIQTIIAGGKTVNFSR